MGWFPSRKKPDKSGVEVNTQIDTDVATSSSQKSGTGLVGKVLNKGGVTLIDNSVHNYYAMPKELSDEEKEEMRAQFFAGELQFVEKDSVKEIEGYEEYEQNSEDDAQLMAYFQDKISDSDIFILRTGLYLRKLAQEGKHREAMLIKERAIRANSRAKNIINLVSEGHFEGYIRPIFEASKDDIKEAQEHYEEIVCDLPEIVFVYSGMGVADIVNKVKKKIDERERYHVEVKRVMVNGIGEQCVKNILCAQEEIAEIYPNYVLEFHESRIGKMRRARLEIRLND